MGSFRPTKEKIVFMVIVAIGVAMVFLSADILMVDINEYFDSFDFETSSWGTLPSTSEDMSEAIRAIAHTTYYVGFALFLILLYVVSSLVERKASTRTDYEPLSVKIVVILSVVIGVITFGASYLLLFAYPIEVLIPSAINGVAVFIMVLGSFYFRISLAKVPARQE